MADPPARSRNLGRTGVLVRRSPGRPADPAQRLLRHLRPPDRGFRHDTGFPVRVQRDPTGSSPGCAAHRRAHQGNPDRTGLRGGPHRRAGHREGGGGAVKGITWDHPRGYGPLDELGGVAWARQPLEGFESTPIADLAAEYDLMVVDHPGLGSALDTLVPLEEVLSEEELVAWRANAIGASYDSYILNGQTWALPIDAATQVAAGTITDPPRTWDEVRELARDGGVTLCLGGPHALLTFFALCLARGAEPFTDAATGEWAIELMAELIDDSELWRHNPIAVLSAKPLYCPLVYGYVTYTSLSFW